MTGGRSAALLLLLAASAAACSGGNAESKQPPKRPPVPVAVAAVERKSIPLQIQAIGTVEAYQVVSVRGQVGGELMRVHIKEGQDVHKGDLLFTIDPRTYEAALAQAQATLAKDHGQVQQARAALQRDIARVSQSRAALVRDQAQAKNAEVQERRYRDLLKRELIAQEQYDQIKTTYESLAATVRADEALVDNARVQLGYTTIRSPIDGRTGSLQLNLGNVVRSGGTSDSTLLVINQVQPVYVSFTVPQQQLPQIKRYMAGGTLAVEAVASGESRSERGTVTFIDNAVDQNTGTIRLKATFANAERRLWPGQFVNVALTLAVEPDAIVVPAQALQTGQQGAFVFVVKPDSTVEARRVVVARTQGSESVIASGLAPGESVVTDGQPRLVQGAKVEVRSPTGRQAGGERGVGPRGGGAGAGGTTGAASPPSTPGGPGPGGPASVAPKGAAPPSR